MGVYLRIKFEVSSIIVTSFRQEGGRVVLPPLPQPQNEPLKRAPRLQLTYTIATLLKLIAFCIRS